MKDRNKINLILRIKEAKQFTTEEAVEELIQVVKSSKSFQPYSFYWGGLIGSTIMLIYYLITN